MITDEQFIEAFFESYQEVVRRIPQGPITLTWKALLESTKATWHPFIKHRDQITSSSSGLDQAYKLVMGNLLSELTTAQYKYPTFVPEMYEILVEKLTHLDGPATSGNNRAKIYKLKASHLLVKELGYDEPSPETPIDHVAIRYLHNKQMVIIKKSDLVSEAIEVKE